MSMLLGLRAQRVPREAVVACVLALVTFGTYLPALAADFVDLDDYAQVVSHEWVSTGLSWQGMRWALTQRLFGNWHPLTTLSHMLDVELFGLDPFGHHLTNVLLHLLNGTLLLLGLHRWTGRLPESAAVAALFLLHPLNVETVAWVSQRKSLLSTAFGFVTIGAYVRYVRHRSRTAYLASLGAYAACLMSKAMFITLPALLLVLEAWPLRRWSAAAARGAWPERAVRVLSDKLPFVLVALACAAVAMQTQQTMNSVRSLDDLGVGERLATVALGYAAYLRLLFWPFDLTVLRDHPFLAYTGAAPVGLATVLGSGALVAALGVLAVRERSRRPFVAAGYAWYLLSAVPVIGFVQLSDQLIADRYTYVPLLGIYVALAWVVGDALGRLPTRPRAGTLTVVGSLLVLAMVARSVDQLRHWQDSVALYERVAAYRPHSAKILHRLGRAYKNAQRMERSLEYYARALEQDPTDAESLRLLAAAPAAIAREPSAETRARALAEYRGIVSAQLRREDGRRRLALALLVAGHPDEAVHWLDALLRAHPDDADLQRAMAQARSASTAAP